MTLQDMYDHAEYKDTRYVDRISVAGDGVQIGPKQLCSFLLASLHT